jgi:hypothetical protein
MGRDASGRLVLRQQLVFPGLRKIPNDTRGSYTLKLSDHVADSILVDGQPIVEKPVSFYIRGLLRSVSRTQTPLIFSGRSFHPLINGLTWNPTSLRIPGRKITDTCPCYSNNDSVTDGKNEVDGPFVVSRRTYEGGDAVLMPGNSLSFSYVISVRSKRKMPTCFRRV